MHTCQQDLCAAWKLRCAYCVDTSELVGSDGFSKANSANTNLHTAAACSGPAAKFVCIIARPLCINSALASDTQSILAKSSRCNLGLQLSLGQETEVRPAGYTCRLLRPLCLQLFLICSL